MEIKSRFEDIGPEKAMKYLETMDTNRIVRQTRVDYYASMMKAGLWRKTHQGIAFDTEGHLVDGQHRMWAVIDANKTITIMVSTGLSPDDVAAMDGGLTRSYNDVGHYAGWENADPVAGAVAKGIVMGPGQASRMVPPEVMHEWYEFYKDACDFGVRVRNATRGAGSKVIPIGATIAFAKASITYDQDRLMRFADILKTGVIAHDNERAALTYRDAWLTKRLGVTMLEQYQKTSAAIRAFDQKRAVKHLQRAEVELFEVPKLPMAIRYTPVNNRHSKARAAQKAEKVS